MNPLTDEEIEYAEKLLLPEGDSFNDERRDVLRNLSSLNVQACPGSGKTTVLLAKLLILANRIPFEDKRGICVLTHTNVAIDEIKERLANKTGVLFRYPNFFGTFQSFVDKFLAIPACIHYFKCRPDRVDGELYDKKSDWIYSQISWDNPLKLKNWLYGSANRNQNGLTTKEKNNNARTLFRSIKVDYVNKKLLPEINSNRTLLTLSSKNENAREKCKEIIALKNEIIIEGVLGYDEAYLLSLKYLADYKGILKTAFQKRFSYVFVDEMQDTDIHQNEIIDTLFDSIDVVVQKIGDKNQAIYGKVKAESLWNPDSLPINDSKRFHNSIAEKVKSICIEENNQLTGNNSNDLVIAPIIIVFDDPKQVLAKYGELIVQYGLHEMEVRKGKKNVFKAIGWRKDHDGGQLSISSYWDEYVIEVKSKKAEFENLNEYLVFDETLSKQGFRFFKDRVFSIFLKSLSITENKVEKNEVKKNYSKTTLISHMKNLDDNIYDNFQIKISEWLLSCIQGQSVEKRIGDYIKKLILSIFTMSNESKLDQFLNSENNSSGSQPGIEKHEPANNFRYEYSQGKFIDIKVGTIHSAKGETHTATLYLETYYRKKHEGDRLIDFLKGSYNTKLADKTEHIESLKMAYVGMTRPSHFLCVAMHQSRIAEHEDELEKSGWKIEKI